MDLLLTLLVGVPAQIGVFSLVPLAWWLQAGRPEGSLLRWLGFRELRGDGRTALVLAAAGGLGFLGSAVVGGPAWWATSASGVGLVLAVILTAVLQTALAEEIFFRGFLLRWLDERRAGPMAANLLQAALYGLLRAAGQWLFVDRAPASCLAALALAGGSAFLVGWVRQYTGSILLPWAAHGAGNLVGGLIVAFR
ncbi:MAG: CPBP family intramembrane metalloprotease [Micropruina sp.]|uniref:CPBP family intramembrane glutamic endopeptidase n=1 Tax=Micropruina sp. TaxID=2737536 RepID=UPI0039E27285